jgi:hypothetical protein
VTALSFDRLNSIFRWLPSSVRARLHAHLPRRLEQQAWDALRVEVEEQRALARDAGFTHVSELVEDELKRLRRFRAA